VVVLGGGGGCPFRCPRCVSCSGLVASFVHRCRSSVLGVCSVSFVLHFLSCIGWIVLGFAPNSLLFNAKRVRHDHKKNRGLGRGAQPSPFIKAGGRGIWPCVPPSSLHRSGAVSDGGTSIICCWRRGPKGWRRKGQEPCGFVYCKNII
jgi:hypothetical protein